MPYELSIDDFDTDEPELPVLERNGSKGVFVLWPKEWPKQWRDPVGRRYQSGCDMLIGHCQCGRIHREEDRDVQSHLEQHGVVIESHEAWRRRTLAERTAV